jgi:DNA-binding response OmpR family regulator
MAAIALVDDPILTSAILDIKMPRMDGMDAGLERRRCGRNPTCR